MLLPAPLAVIWLSDCGVEPIKGEVLEIGSVVACRFKPVERKLRGDVFGGEVAAAQRRLRGLPEAKSLARNFTVSAACGSPEDRLLVPTPRQRI